MRCTLTVLGRVFGFTHVISMIKSMSNSLFSLSYTIMFRFKTPTFDNVMVSLFAAFLHKHDIEEIVPLCCINQIPLSSLFGAKSILITRLGCAGCVMGVYLCFFCLRRPLCPVREEAAQVSVCCGC